MAESSSASRMVLCQLTTASVTWLRVDRQKAARPADSGGDGRGTARGAHRSHDDDDRAGQDDQGGQPAERGPDGLRTLALQAASPPPTPAWEVLNGAEAVHCFLLDGEQGLPQEELPLQDQPFRPRPTPWLVHGDYGRSSMRATAPSTPARLGRRAGPAPAWRPDPWAPGAGRRRGRVSRGVVLGPPRQQVAWWTDHHPRAAPGPRSGSWHSSPPPAGEGRASASSRTRRRPEPGARVAGRPRAVVAPLLRADVAGVPVAAQPFVVGVLHDAALANSTLDLKNR